MAAQTDILIVFPNNRLRAYGSLGAEIAASTPPVQDGLLAAYLRGHGSAVVLLDAEAAGKLPDEVAVTAQRLDPLLVAISTDQVNSGDVTKMAAAGETVRAVKRLVPGLPVIMLGNVPSAYPEQMLREEGPDYVCQGEPYEPVHRLLALLQQRGRDVRLSEGEVPGIWARYGETLVTSPHASYFRDLDALPFPAWDLMPPAGYRAHHWHCFDRLQERSPYAAIFTNMGCPYTCTFCSVNVAAGGPNLRFRQPERVCGEIDLLVREYNVRNIRILDNVFTARLDRVEQLCDRIAARWQGLNFWAYARVESVRNPDILVKLKKAGIHWLAYGFEAAHDRVKQAVNKTTRRDTTDQVIEWTRRAGIHIVANFIFGLPEDDVESMQLSLSMAQEYNFEWANFYCAMAYPGTELYAQARKNGVALPKTWSGYGQYSPDALPLPTKHLSSRDVLAFRDNAFRTYYTDSRYQRMLQAKFGDEAVQFVRHILAHEIKRNG